MEVPAYGTCTHDSHDDPDLQQATGAADTDKARRGPAEEEIVDRPFFGALDAPGSRGEGFGPSFGLVDVPECRPRLVFAGEELVVLGQNGIVLDRQEVEAVAAGDRPDRSEERRVGKAGGSTCRT